MRYKIRHQCHQFERRRTSSTRSVCPTPFSCFDDKTIDQTRQGKTRQKDNIQKTRQKKKRQKKTKDKTKGKRQDN